jgi:uncharacterized protein YqhQ
MPESKIPSYGGQALMEGVLMRGSRAVAAAMRAPDGKIVVQTEPLTGIYQSKIKTIPFLRGLVLLWDALVLGTRFLSISANLQVEEEEKIEGPALYGTLALSMVIGIGIFVLIPSGMSHLIELWLGLGFWANNLIEGIFRLAMAIGYIWSVGKIPEISKVFAYHGAEHKTINAYEAGAELTPESVARYPLEHPRCGTGFILTVVVFSIILFSPLRTLTFLLRILLQLLLVPAVACLAYEYMRWTANHLELGWVRKLVSPNLALQKLTTRQPSLDMLEVSITAFKEMFALEQNLLPVQVKAGNSPDPILSSQLGGGKSDQIG